MSVEQEFSQDLKNELKKDQIRKKDGWLEGCRRTGTLDTPVMAGSCRRSDTIRIGKKGPAMANQGPRKRGTCSSGVVRPVTRPGKKKEGSGIGSKGIGA